MPEAKFVTEGEDGGFEDSVYVDGELVCSIDSLNLNDEQKQRLEGMLNKVLEAGRTTLANDARALFKV
ncbi:MAG: hypothetical protein MJA28_06320 [Gammaproteobacteria bacterium]|nr:hypothetical protein [Gammaproteobacteria bacterium]